MDVLVLGGQSVRHREWVRQVADVLRPDFERVVVLDYRHWQAGAPDIDMAYELRQASRLAQPLNNYVVVAKSIGNVIAMLANAGGRLAPQRCVFLGFPLVVVQRQALPVASALASLPPTVFVQNTADPLGGAEEVQTYILAHQPPRYRFRTSAGATHDYSDFALIRRLAAGQDDRILGVNL